MRPTSCFCTGAAGRIGVVLALVATLVVTSLAPPAWADAGEITTVVGSERRSFAGDGGLATEALLDDPSGVAVDGAGNLFIADLSNNRVRRVDAVSGVITTVAGTGTAGFSGDGGPATAAQLASPAGLALDGAGNLFIADLSNDRVRRVEAASGVITTVAGVGTGGFSGDGGPATVAQIRGPSGVSFAAGSLFIADQGNGRIRRVTPEGTIHTVAGKTGQPPYNAYSGDGGPATEATMNSPTDVAVDPAGTMYIADRVNDRIRKVDTAGIITTMAGTGTDGFSGDGGPATSAQLFEPAGVALDGAGNLFIADFGNHRVRKVDTAGTITTVAGLERELDEAVDGSAAGSSGDGGPATDARLNRPVAVAVGGAGSLFIADQRNDRVRQVRDGIITTAAGASQGGSGDGGPATEAQIDNPRGMDVDAAGNLFFADLSNRRVRKVDAAGVITTVAGTGAFASSGDGGPATDAELLTPIDVAVDAAGNLYIADRNDHRVRKVDAAGVITTVAGVGPGAGGAGGFSGDGGPAVGAALNQPTGVAVDAAGNLYIADRDNHRIRKVDTAGVITTVAGTGAAGYSGDGGQAGAAQLNSPADVVVDAGGGVVIADSGNHRVRRIDTAGVMSTVAGDGTLGFADGPAGAARFSVPTGVATGPRGAIYVADQGNHAVRRIDAAGFVATVAGTGVQGFAGDGGQAAEATLSFPSAVVADGASVLVADTANHRIRAISPLRADLMAACPPGVTAPSGFVDIGGNAHLAAIECVAWYGIALGGPSGLADNAYGPDLDVRRDQMASFIARLIDHVGTDVLPAGDGANAFDCDVDPNNPHYANIQRLAAAGVVLGGPNGLADNCFGPAQTVRRDQMASFINRAVEKVTGTALASDADVFDDDDTSVHQANINGVASEGIVLGTAAGGYGPGGQVGRDQMASFVARTADYLVDEGFTEPPP